MHSGVVEEFPRLLDREQAVGSVIFLRLRDAINSRPTQPGYRLNDVLAEVGYDRRGGVNGVIFVCHVRTMCRYSTFCQPLVLWLFCILPIKYVRIWRVTAVSR